MPTKAICVSLPADTLDMLDALVRARGIPRSRLLREFIDQATVAAADDASEGLGDATVANERALLNAVYAWWLGLPHADRRAIVAFWLRGRL